MKKIVIPCDCAEGKVPLTFYIGKPVPGRHPIGQQAAWFAHEKGCTVPQEVWDSLQKLWNIAQENGVSFEELVTYAMPDEVEDVETPKTTETTETNTAET